MKKAGAAMKKAGAMKAGGKAMKAKKVSVIAVGRRAKSSVFSGRKERTTGGLTKASLVKNRHGKVVSKKRSAFMKQQYAGSKLKAWAEAVKTARHALGLTGFVGIGGKTAAGKALYAKAKAVLSA